MDTHLSWPIGTVLIADLQYSTGVRPSVDLNTLAMISHLFVGPWHISFFFTASALHSCLRITRHRLSTIRLYPCFCICAHSATIPSVGFHRYISAISLSSSWMCCLGAMRTSGLARRGLQGSRRSGHTRSRCKTGFCCTYAGTSCIVLLSIGEHRLSIFHVRGYTVHET